MALYDYWNVAGRSEHLPSSMRGVFWFNDNQAPELLICFEGCECDAEKREVYLPWPVLRAARLNHKVGCEQALAHKMEREWPEARRAMEAAIAVDLEGARSLEKFNILSFLPPPPRLETVTPQSPVSDQGGSAPRPHLPWLHRIACPDYGDT